MTDSHSLESVRAVLSAHREEIRRRYRAVGTGIGRPDAAGPHVIVVYVADQADVPADPGTVEGVALHFKVTGPFQAQGS